jgi:uncharacterized protein (DUF2249 family)
MPTSDVLDRGDVPDREAVVELDVRDLPPPKPLQATLEALEGLDDDAVLVQANDRRPKHLFPHLEERGYASASSGDDTVYTAIWKP